MNGMDGKSVRRRYYTPGFHSDVIWLEDQRDYAEVLFACVNQNMAVCRADEGYGIFLHEMTYLKPWLDSHPRDREQYFALLAAGRVGGGGAHSLPSANLISGEAFIRNFAYGRVWQEYLGDRPEIAMLWDIFGHFSQLPQVLGGLRFSGVIWSKDIRGVHPLFWHVGLDGSRLLTRRVMYGYPAHPRETAEKYLADHLAEIEALDHPADLRLDCGDCKPPTPWLVGECTRLAGEKLPWVVSGQAHRHYFREIHAALAAGEIRAPQSGRDLEYHHQGTGLSHSDLKIINRRCENTLHAAELFCSIAAQHGAAYPHLALDKAWRQLFFHQHHDAITGPCCDRSYLDLLESLRETLELAAGARDAALSHLDALSTVHPPGAHAQAALAPVAVVRVFNPATADRCDVVCAEVEFAEPVRGFTVRNSRGEMVPCEMPDACRVPGGIERATVRFTAQVPGTGMTTYWLMASDELPGTLDEHPGDTIENEFFRLRVDTEHGGIVSLYDKRLQRELFTGDAPGNELVFLPEDFTDHPEPPWELNTTGEQLFSRDMPAKVRVCEGAVSSTLIISGEIPSGRREQHITLYRGVGGIEFRTDIIDYTGREEIVAVTFPADLPGAVPIYDDRFGCVAKRRSRGHLDFRTWQWRNYSGGGARRVGQWLDLARTARLIFTEEGRDADGYAIGPMSLVIADDNAVEDATERLQEALVKRAVPCTIFHDHCDRHVRAFLPREDSTMPLESPDEDLPWGTAFRIIGDVSDSNELWLRIREGLDAAVRADFEHQRGENGVAFLFVADAAMPEGWPPLPTLVVGAGNGPALAAALDDLARQVRETGDIRLGHECNRAGALPTAPAHGLALLNRGNVLNSVEADGTMVLFLMHCVPWARTPWGPDRLDFHLVAEHKTHRFHYALYPHAGDWRDGRVPHVADAYNNPLIARQATVGEESEEAPRNLPHEGAFLAVEGGLLSALKPAGYPVACHETPDPHPDCFTVRFYEPFGRTGEAAIHWPGGMAEVHRANLLDEAQETLECARDELRLPVGPFSITSLLVKPAGTPERLTPSLQERQKGIIPARYWQHNVGEAPLGFMPVCVTLHGEVHTDTHVGHGGYTVNTVEVGVVNNLPREARGRVELLCGEGWRAVPEAVLFSVPPRESRIYPVTVVFESARRDGVLRARWTWDGQEYEDTLVVGAPKRPKVKARLKDGFVQVRVSNRAEDILVADLYVITPHENWGALVDNAAAFMGPRHVPIQLAAGEKAWFDISVDSADNAAVRASWFVVKLAYNGQVLYQPVRLS